MPVPFVPDTFMCPDKYDKAMKDLVMQHQDYKIFKSLPAGSYATHGWMIAAMGDDRLR